MYSFSPPSLFLSEFLSLSSDDQLELTLLSLSPPSFHYCSPPHPTSVPFWSISLPSYYNTRKKKETTRLWTPAGEATSPPATGEGKRECGRRRGTSDLVCGEDGFLPWNRVGVVLSLSILSSVQGVVKGLAACLTPPGN